jgi:hypothetical protein
MASQAISIDPESDGVWGAQPVCYSAPMGIIELGAERPADFEE